MFISLYRTGNRTQLITWSSWSCHPWDAVRGCILSKEKRDARQSWRALNAPWPLYILLPLWTVSRMPCQVYLFIMFSAFLCTLGAIIHMLMCVVYNFPLSKYLDLRYLMVCCPSRITYLISCPNLEIGSLYSSCNYLGQELQCHVGDQIDEPCSEWSLATASTVPVRPHTDDSHR
jgi:hypothetical protein